MQCKRCNFVVPQNLKFVIMKNFCPQCGEKLFSEKEMNQISVLQSRIDSQYFAKTLDESTIFDLAIFIFNEFYNGLGRVLIDEELKRIKDQVSSDITHVESDDLKESEIDKENIRNQIREEFKSKVPSEYDDPSDDQDDYDLGDEDELESDDKVSKLKQIYEKQKGRVKNTPIRRIDS